MYKLTLLLLIAFELCNLPQQSTGHACLADNQDLIFVVGSTSGPSAWRSLLDFVNHVIDCFPNASKQPGVRVSFVRYLGRRPYVPFYLDAHHNNKSTLTNAIKSIEYIRGGGGDEAPAETGYHQQLATAINVARSVAFQPQMVNGSSASWKTIVVVADGLQLQQLQRSSSSTADAERLQGEFDETRGSGIELIIVGIGSQVRELLSQIGGRNGAWYRSIFVDDRGQLDGIVASTTALVCSEGSPSAAAVIHLDSVVNNNEYDTYLDTGVYSDASIEVERPFEDESRRSHTSKVTAVSTVVGLLVVLMVAIAFVIYLRGRGKGGVRSGGHNHYRGLRVHGLNLTENARKASTLSTATSAIDVQSDANSSTGLYNQMVCHCSPPAELTTVKSVMKTKKEDKYSNKKEPFY